MQQTYLYREGDGNEGNYPRFIITLAETDDPFAALAALVENRYIVDTRTRRHVRANVQTEGEPEYGIAATVHEGPWGEQAFGAAWITAELEPLEPADIDYYRDQGMTSHACLREAIDLAAFHHYRRIAR